MYSDLRAYVCTFSKCGMRMFEKRSQWIKHEMSEHRRRWTCRLCAKTTFNTEADLQKHLEVSHGLPSDDNTQTILVESGSCITDLIPVQDCLLCDWSTIMTNINPQAEDTTELAVPYRRFMKHVAGHLEELALFALPIAYIAESADGATSRVGANSAAAAHGDRASMDSQPLSPWGSQIESSNSDSEGLEVFEDNQQGIDGEPSPDLQARPTQFRTIPLDFEVAMSYVELIEAKYADDPKFNQDFLNILKTYKSGEGDPREIRKRVYNLLANIAGLLPDFDAFASTLGDDELMLLLSALSQGKDKQSDRQVPVLNDALSYIGHVKSRFADEPSVYNEFVNVWQDFEAGAMGEELVIDKICGLFSRKSDLIEGFNPFLGPGYRMELLHGSDFVPSAVRITTPMGTGEKVLVPSNFERQSDLLPDTETDIRVFLDQPNDLPGEPQSPIRMTTREDEQEDDQIICVCGYAEDDGWTVQCEQCQRWQHILCYYPSYENENLPDSFVHYCVDCKPRQIDSDSARQRQMQRQQEQTAHSSARRIAPAIGDDHEAHELPHTWRVIDPGKGVREEDFLIFENLTTVKSRSGRNKLYESADRAIRSTSANKPPFKRAGSYGPESTLMVANPDLGL